MMLVFGFGSYRLAKVCVRGICSAVSGDDMVFVHGCTLSVGAEPRRGVVITGSSGAGKTTLVAGLLRHREYPVAVLNDDWGAVSLARGDSVGGNDAAHEDRQRAGPSSGLLHQRPAGSYSRNCPSGTGPPGCWCRRKVSTARNLPAADQQAGIKNPNTVVASIEFVAAGRDLASEQTTALIHYGGGHVGDGDRDRSAPGDQGLELREPDATGAGRRPVQGIERRHRGRSPGAEDRRPGRGARSRYRSEKPIRSPLRWSESFQYGVHQIDDTQVFALLRTAQVLWGSPGGINQLRLRLDDAVAAKDVAGQSRPRPATSRSRGRRPTPICCRRSRSGPSSCSRSWRRCCSRPVLRPTTSSRPSPMRSDTSTSKAGGIARRSTTRTPPCRAAHCASRSQRNSGRQRGGAQAARSVVRRPDAHRYRR